MEAIFNRCSVRSFQQRKVSADDIESMLRAAMAAPSAGNQQPWEFYVVQNPLTCQALAASSSFSKPAADAPAVIVPCIRNVDLKFPECVQQDMSAAIENMLVAAAELGLGTVWMGIAPSKDRIMHVVETLALPADMVPFALVAVGYPAEIPSPKGAERYDAKRIHWV